MPPVFPPAIRSVAVAVSGGVDSACALLMLKREGYDVFALHGLFAPNALPPPALERLAADLDVPLFTVDLANIFQKRVIEYFAREYAAGYTPNPCAVCNRFIKFGALWKAARALGAGHIATGHYVRLLQDSAGHFRPAVAADRAKDQSYFLGLVGASQFERAIFPLAGITKSECREFIRKAGIDVPQKKESQDICFVNDGDWQAFIRNLWRRLGMGEPAPGPVILRGEDGKRERIGEHQGLWRHTTGQRKGLGIPFREPLYVLGKDMEHNALLVGLTNNSGDRSCRLEEVNFFIEPQKWPKEIFARLRYRQKPARCSARIANGQIFLEFETPIQAAPGQVGVVYDGAGGLLAGGIIR